MKNTIENADRFVDEHPHSLWKNVLFEYAAACSSGKEQDRDQLIKFIGWYAAKFEMRFTDTFEQSLVEEFLHTVLPKEPEKK